MDKNMALFPVNDEKNEGLAVRMEKLGIREADIVESFVRGSGSGGQKINKTSSCVQLFHKPTGIEVKCQRERSQAMNRFFARRELCDRVEERVKGIQSARQQEHEKIRRQKRRRSRRQKQIMVDAKKRHGAKKAMRRSMKYD
jgi:protein subunit release factor B